MNNSTPPEPHNGATSTSPNNGGLQPAAALASASAPKPPAPYGATVLRHLTNFTPHLLALALALGTFWLVRSMPQSKPNKPPLPANEPDYYMRDFAVYRYTPNGSLQTKLQGSYGEHLPGPDTLHIQQITTYSVDDQGNTTHGSAQRGVSDSKGQNIELFDQVKLTHQRKPAAGQAPEPPTVFEGPYLKATNRQAHISSDKPVKITQGGNVITGSGLNYTDSAKTLEIQGRAQAVIPPSPKH